MKVVMYDMITADEWIKVQGIKDSSVFKNYKNLSLYNKIFSLHSISKNDFYDSYSYYQNNPNEMKVLLDSLTNFANRKRDSVSAHQLK